MRRALTSILAWSAILMIAPVASATSLTRGPYLGRPDDRSVAVVWRTDVATNGVLSYGIAGETWTTVDDVSSATEHRIALDHLESGARYGYTVGDGGAVLAQGTFVAPRSGDETTFSFGVIGDTDGDAAGTLAKAMATENVDFVLHTGDVVYPAGAEADYDAKFFRPFESLIEGVPVLPAIGNHDAKTAKGAALLDDFVLPKNDSGNSRYYALRQGNALFICLDVETSSYGYGSAQYRWLDSVLRTSDATWKFVWLHEPPYSSAQANNLVRLVLCPIFEYYGVDVVFSGHEHLYERTSAIHDFVKKGKGVIYVTVGGGGAKLSRFQPEDDSAFVDARFCYVTARIDRTMLTLEAHDPDGRVFDSVVLGSGPPPKAGTRSRRVRRHG
ncbi:MAG: metallophosphoesterase [Thermoanaerobaculia bacterium]